MRRRNILVTSGTALATGFAGCLGGSDGNDDGNGEPTADQDGREQEPSDGKNTAPIEDWGYYSPTATKCREEEYFSATFHHANSAEIYCGFATKNRCVAIEASILWEEEGTVVVEMEEQPIDPPEETPTDKPDDEGYANDCKDCGEKLHLRARGVNVQTTKDMERARGIYIDIDGNRSDHEEVRE